MADQKKGETTPKTPAAAPAAAKEATTKTPPASKPTPVTTPVADQVKQAPTTTSQPERHAHGPIWGFIPGWLAALLVALAALIILFSCGWLTWSIGNRLANPVQVNVKATGGSVTNSGNSKVCVKQTVVCSPKKGCTKKRITHNVTRRTTHKVVPKPKPRPTPKPISCTNGPDPGVKPNEVTTESTVWQP